MHIHHPQPPGTNLGSPGSIMRATLPQPPPPSPASRRAPTWGGGRAAGGQAAGRPWAGAAAGEGPSSRHQAHGAPGRGGAAAEAGMPGTRTGSVLPAACPARAARGRTRGEGGRIECLRCLPALGVPGAHPLFCTAVSGALSWQQLPTRSLPSWGPASGAPKQTKGPEARVSGGAREAREDWATGSESPYQQSLMPDLKGIPHSRLSRSPTSLKPGLDLTLSPPSRSKR